MPSRYIDAGDYVALGLPTTTTTAQVDQASALIDAQLKRPEGLVYVPDDAGNPVYMKGLLPSSTFRIPAGLSPGSNVQATVTGPFQTLKAGGALVVDKDDQSKAEVLSVMIANGAVVTIANVTRAHATDAVYEAGLVINESKHIPTNRPITMLSRAPIVRLVQGQGKYAQSRRSRHDNPYDQSLADILAVFGPNQWETINLSITDFDPDTGQVWLPSGLLVANFNEVKFSYLAGYTAASVPQAIKMVAVNLIKTHLNSPLQGNLKSMKAGGQMLERFLATVMGQDEKNALAPYQARVYA